MPAGGRTGGKAGKAAPQLQDAERDNRMLFRLFRTSNLMTRRNTVWLARLGITAEQCSVLSTLSRPQSAGGMTVNALCEYLMVSRQGLNGVLQRLDRLGLTRRATEARDRRIKRVELTPRGHTCVARIMPLMSAFSATALRGFSDAELQQFMRLTDRLRRNLMQPPGAGSAPPRRAAGTATTRAGGALRTAEAADWAADD
ncbi:MAG: winged helix-turn-helix transcriptional regulator [Nevskia sp.]|nr:winged helix-turn-helix transcriptional regulator [Nevskia sp.]